MNRHIITTHTHVCPCGSFLPCTQDADRCDVPEPYECTRCQDETMAAWYLSRHPNLQEPQADESKQSDR